MLVFSVTINFRGYNKRLYKLVEKVGFGQLVLIACSIFQNLTTGLKQNDSGGRVL